MSLKSHIIKTAAGLGLAALPFAQASAGDVTVGGGMRTSFSAMNFDTVVGEDEVESDSTSDFALNSARLYISGKATDNIGFMFNTEYNSDDEEIRVIDAAAQFSFSGGTHNIWVGRFLPPSDRANLYGPYYASNWAVYQDGVQDGYPFETEGRDDHAFELRRCRRKPEVVRDGGARQRHGCGDRGVPDATRDQRDALARDAVRRHREGEPTIVARIRANAQRWDRDAGTGNRSRRLVGHAPADGRCLLGGCHGWHHSHQNRRAGEHTIQIARHVLYVPRRRLVCKNNVLKKLGAPRR